MKKIIFLFHFLVLTSAFTSFAQVTYNIAAPVSLTRCGARQTVTVNVSTVTSLMDHTFNIDFNITGLHIYNPRNSDRFLFPSFVEGASILTVNAANLSGNTSIQFDVWAGCSVEASYLSAALQVKNNTLTIQATQSVNLFANQNGALLEPNGNPPSQIGNVGDLIERTFIYKNTSPRPYTGVLNINDNISVSSNTSLSIVSIEVWYANGSVQTLTNNVTASLNQVIDPGMSFTIKETVKITKCINTTDRGRSNIHIQTGCSSDDLCNGKSYSTEVVQGNGAPVILRDSRFERSTPYYTCFDESQPQQASYGFMNTGNAPANGLQFSFIPVTGHITYQNSFVIEIFAADGVTIKSSGTALVNHNYVQGESNIYGIDQSSNEASSFDYYRDLLGDPAASGVLAYTPSCGESQAYLICRVISDYIDGFGIQQSIRLLPGERVRINWKDKHCCSAANTFTGGFSIPIIKAFLADCDGNPKMVASTFGQGENQFAQDVLPYNPTMKGNQDKCLSTFDGETQIISIQNKQAYYNLLPDDVNTWGDLIVDLAMETGADLDITLGGNALPELYTNSCGFADCGNACATPNMAVSDPNRYLIRFINDAGKEWLPSAAPIRISSTAEGSVYRITFSYKTLSALAGTHPLPEWTKSYANTLLSSMRLEFKLRSVCPAPPVTNILETLSYRPDQTICSSQCLMPLYTKDLHVTVVCPGCLTPGGNVLNSTLERIPEFLGLKDNNNNGIPDSDDKVEGLLKVNCTNGDQLTGKVTVFISDGDTGGYTLSNLTNRNTYLDNLYIKIAPSQSGILQASSGKAEISIDETSWYSVDFLATTGGEFIAHAKPADLAKLSLADFNNFVGQNIYLRYNLNVISENVVTSNGPGPSKLIYVISQAYFSDCDQCVNAADWSFSGGDASNTICDWSNTSASCNLTDKFYWCASYENLINYIPVVTNLVKYSVNDGLINACTQRMESVWQARAFVVNSFRNEYRSFVHTASNQEIVNSSFSFPIPSGYKVSGLKIGNGVDKGRTISQSIDIGDYLILSNETEVNQAIANNVLQVSGGNVIVNIHHEILNGSNILGTQSSLLYTGQGIRVPDDNVFIVCQVEFTPIICKNVPFESVYIDAGASTSLVVPPYSLISNQVVATLPSLPNTLAGNQNVPSNGTPIYSIHKPETQLNASAATSVYLDGNNYYISLKLDNLDPLDGFGNPVRDVLGNAIHSIDAYNPFLFVSNKSALALQGVSVIGVYEGVVNSSNFSSASNSFYNGSTGIASLKKNGQNFIPRNTTGNEYTLVVQYTCPIGCDPMLANYNDDDSQLPSCIKEIKQLLLKYGWNCTAYPQNTSEIANACDVKDLSNPIVMNVPAVAIQISPKLNNNLPVILCQNFPYEVQIQSLKDGNIEELNLELNLPANVELVSSDYSITNPSPGVYIASDITTGSMFNKGAVKTINFTLRLKEQSAVSFNITSKVTGKTYCTSSFIRTVYSTGTVQSIIVGINTTGIYCVNATPVQITTTVGPGTFTALTGLADHGDGTATFTPSVAGVGSYTINYTTSDGCAAKKIIEVIATPTVTTNIPNALCVGSAPLVLTSNPAGAVFSGAGVTSSNGVYQFHGDQNGFYNVQYIYTSTSGCVVTGQKTIHVEDFTVNLSAPGLSCIGESVGLTATVNGSSSGSLIYTWNKIISGTSIYLSGPSVSNVYSYSNYLGTTTFEVSASNGSCTVVSNQLTVNPNSPDECCRYKLGDITLDCSTATQNICVPLTAVRNVPAGIIGMDFCLKYDPAVMNYTGPTGSTTSSALGTVVTNAGLFGASYAAYNDAINGILRVSIYYTGSGSGLASFKGSGQIVCLNFSVPNSTSRQGIFPLAMCSVNDLQEAYTLEEKAACWKVGSLTINSPDLVKGSLRNPLYNNGIIGYSANPTFGYAVTSVAAVGADCDLQNLIQPIVILGSAPFSIPTNGLPKIKIKRDVRAELNIPRQQYQLIVNGSDTWKIHRMTTMDPILNQNVASDERRNLYWYAIAAADVNMNGHVRANDISLVQERIISKRDYFPQLWNNGLATSALDWRFVDQTTVLSNGSFKKSSTYPNSDGSGFHRENTPNIPLCLDARKTCNGQIPEAYYGIMLGDVYRSSTGQKPGTNAYLRTSSEPSSITVDAKHAQYLGNNIYRVPVMHKYAYEYSDNLFAIDIYMDYNQQKIRVNNVLYTSVTTDGGVSMMWNNADEDEFILTSYATLDSIAGSGICYYLDIEKFTDEPFKKADFGTLQFLLNGELVEAKVETGETITSTTDGQSSIKPHVTVIPNPASGATMIDFAVSNNSNDNRIIITDVLGRLVKSFEHVQNFGMLDFSTDDLAAGMYIITLKGENGFGLSEKFQVRK
ncbi:MAG: T9SS type A sorting domain-containing protein [Cytophagaceae bacterium]|nr:T9SS type A sorting domain-containing protein [Cytophagaceae bacterium]